MVRSCNEIPYCFCITYEIENYSSPFPSFCHFKSSNQADKQLIHYFPEGEFTATISRGMFVKSNVNCKYANQASKIYTR